MISRRQKQPLGLLPANVLEKPPAGGRNCNGEHMHTDNLHVCDGSLRLRGLYPGHVVAWDEALQACLQGFSHPPLSVPAGDTVN